MNQFPPCVSGIALCLLAVGVLVGFGCTGSREEPPSTIAVIPKETTHVYWQSIHAGARKAAEETNVRMDWIGPVRDDPVREQIEILRNQVDGEVDGIVLAPIDATALHVPVREAVDAGVPVVIIDSPLADGEDLVTSFVASNNRAAGQLAGERLSELVGRAGVVALLRYAEGSASTVRREDGFLEAIEAAGEVQVVGADQYAGSTKAGARQAAERMLDRLTAPDGSITADGVFTSNESTTYGLLQALRARGLTDSVRFVGFDASETLLQGLRANEIDGLVVQDPFRMGYLGTRTLVDRLRGDSVRSRVDPGVYYVNEDNVDEAEIQRVVDPPVSRWLSVD